VNPWVPGGYDHVINSVGDTQLNASRIQFACPNHWYHIPAIQIKVQYTVTGWADYQRMRLSSDDAMQAKLNSLPTCTTDATGAYANAPCATHSGPLWNGSSYSVPNGASFHTDWMMGWDGLTLKTWEANCLGVRNLVLNEWESHGAVAISDMREKNPGDFCKMVASLLPRDVNLNLTNDLSELSDDELLAQLRDLTASIAPLLAGREQGTEAQGSAEVASRVH
jgi:hypothetical protein